MGEEKEGGRRASAALAPMRRGSAMCCDLQRCCRRCRLQAGVQPRWQPPQTYYLSHHQRELSVPWYGVRGGGGRDRSDNGVLRERWQLDARRVSARAAWLWEA